MLVGVRLGGARERLKGGPLVVGGGFERVVRKVGKAKSRPALYRDVPSLSHCGRKSPADSEYGALVVARE